MDKNANWEPQIIETRIVGHECQLVTTNHQDPDSWTCEPIGDYNHLLPMVEVR